MEMKFVWQHLYLVLSSCVLTTVLGLLLGIASYLCKPLRGIILWLVDVLQTVPVLALLGLLMLVFGANSTTVILGIMLYALLPIVRNTYVGLKDINPGIKEAAIGMGMTKLQRLFKVELPCSFPLIFTGMRIAVVTSIGTAVFGAVVGGGGLGATINRAIHIRDMATLLQATLSLILMAVVFDAGMGFVEGKLKKR